MSRNPLDGLIDLLVEAVINDMAQDWRPDWRKPDGYEVDAPGALIWQFLRRADQYQRDYAALAQAPAGTYQVMGDSRQWATRKASAEIAARYGMDNLLDPACPNPPHEISQRGAAINWHGDYNALKRAYRRRFSLVKVDLLRPLDDQLTAIRRDLDAERHRRFPALAKRRERTAWPRLLRALDGRASGATWLEISRVLGPADQRQADKALSSRASKWHQTALEIQRDVLAALAAT